MWRAFFLAVGISLCILGAECLVVDKALLAAPSKKTAATTSVTKAPKEFEPPEWAPWSLLAGGVVVLLYSIGLRRSE